MHLPVTHTKEHTVTQERGTALDVDEPDDLTAEDLIEELLVEEISIDGMCGVY
jgi:mycofactocin precursor